MWALVPLELVLEIEIWLVLRVFARRPSTLANCLLVLSLQQDFNHEQVEEVSLLDVRLVIKLVVGASFQLGLLSTGIGETVWLGWIVWVENLGDDQPL